MHEKRRLLPVLAVLVLACGVAAAVELAMAFLAQPPASGLRRVLDVTVALVFLAVAFVVWTRRPWARIFAVVIMLAAAAGLLGGLRGLVSREHGPFSVPLQILMICAFGWPGLMLLVDPAVKAYFRRDESSEDRG